MPTTSPKLGLPVLTLSDSPDIPRDINAITNTLESQVGYVAARQVLDTGQAGQTRAGRVLTAADFTDLGLGVPQGLWLASSGTGQANDQSGGGNNLANKGSVPFGIGIDGSSSSSAVFAGSTAQALYREDTGSADPLRNSNKGGSWGCWFKVAKRDLDQTIISRYSAGDGWLLGVSGNQLLARVPTGNGPVSTSSDDVADDKWHFGVGTFDAGLVKLYLDGVLVGSNFFEAQTTSMNGGASLCIGGERGDSANATANPFFGRVDEAFLTLDVLTDEQVRALYAVKVAHGMAVTPGRVSMSVRRRVRGGLLAATDFPSTPTRLYNLNGVLTDAGSAGVSVAGTGGVGYSPSPDGKRSGSYMRSGSTYLGSSDTGLPAALTTRSYGLWFKATDVNSLLAWGTLATNHDLLLAIVANGYLTAASGADVMTVASDFRDALWHHAVVVEDNAAGDGVKRKLYVDGRLIVTSLVLNSITLSGNFRLGSNVANATGTKPVQLARAFVFAGALTSEQVRALYQKSSVDVGLTPKDPSPHIERIDSSSLLVVCDTLEPQHSVSMVAAL